MTYNTMCVCVWGGGGGTYIRVFEERLRCVGRWTVSCTVGHNYSAPAILPPVHVLRIAGHVSRLLEPLPAILFNFIAVIYNFEVTSHYRVWSGIRGSSARPTRGSRRH